MYKQGKFIVIEGLDGSGKGTQIKLLQELLMGEHVFFTREPGGAGNALAEEIRTMLLRKDGPKSTARADLHLFFASRAAHVELTIEPMRLQGVHVISDRYASSTYAFQIYGEEHYDLKKIFDSSLQDIAAYAPTLYIVLDLPPEVAYERRKKDDEQVKSRFDVKPLEYHERVREGYKAFAKKYGPVEFVDANRPVEEVHTDVWKLVSKELGL